MKKLAVVCTHPIQYNAPVFRLLTERKRIEVKVFYTWEKGAEKFDEGFGKTFKWDIPLLDGYEHLFVSNNGNKKKGFWDVRNPGLNKELERWQPDAILVYGWNYWSHLKAMRYFKGKTKVLFRGDSTLLGEKKGLKRLLRRNFLKWVYSHVDTALYAGARNKDYFLMHGLKVTQLVFAPHAIDNERFFEDRQSGQTYRKELLDHLGIDVGSKNFIYLGKFQKIKNLGTLIRAFNRLNAPDWKLILVGNGMEENELKGIAQKNHNIFFLPFQNQLQIPAVYRLGQIFCLPSWTETWGLSVNEAMACGMGVLVSDKVGCAIDLVEEGVNGYSFQSGNEEDLVKKLEMIMLMDTKEMGRISKQKIAPWRFETQAINIESILLKT